MKRPLVWIALVLSSGIFFASKIKISVFLLYYSSILFLALGIIYIRRDRFFYPLLFCLIFLSGALFFKNSCLLPKCHIAKLVYYKNADTYIVKGIVENASLVKQNRRTFLLKAKEVQMDGVKYSCCGRVLVSLKSKMAISIGEELILEGRLSRPFVRARNKRLNRLDYFNQQGIYSIMRVDSGAGVKILSRPKGIAVKRLAMRIKGRMEGVIFSHMPFLCAGILDAMLLGERRHIPAAINNSMVKSGTVHILVVSGFNVSIIAFIIVLALKLIRLPRKIRIYIAIPCLLLYCLITGASTPVVRATVMAIIFISAYLFKREPDIYNSCAIAVLFILATNPRQLFDIGFQLSFASVISIVSLYPKMNSFLHTESLKPVLLRFVIEGCLVSFSAWLATLGPIAYYFKIFSPVTVLANIFIVPLAAFITLCGFTLAFTGLAFPPAAPLFSSASALAIMLLLKINLLLLRIPGAFFYLP